MDCDRFRELLPGLLAQELAADAAAFAERHARGCGACARELVQHRRTWQLLGVLDDGEAAAAPVRLEQIAVVALARAGEPEGADRDDTAPAVAAGRVASIELLPRSRWRSPWARAAAAALLVASTAFVTRWWVTRVPTPAFLGEPEFITHFELLRDLGELDRGGVLIDLDDELTALDALRGA
ncbi:MAG: hypothetical protein FJ293_10250 [Planctomycetes bacterium]|nr:hypothetical protein [Planctomycetota bacterium]